MIINDTHQFVFVHIPKCAGTTVRSQLQPFDQTGGTFTGRVDEHPEFGIIDYVHIPLFILRQYFPTEYRKLSKYSTFAVVRDPFARFPSSLSQHLKMYGNAPIQNMKASDIKRVIDKTIKFLQDHMGEQSYLPYQYIHFQKQVDFLYDGQERLVSHIYDISEIPEMFVDIGNKLNARLEEGERDQDRRANETVVYRNALVRIVTDTAMPLLKAIFGPEARKNLREMAGDWIFVPRDKKLRDIFDSSHIRDFITEYYASDIKFIDEINSAKPEKRRSSVIVMENLSNRYYDNNKREHNHGL